MKQEFKAGDVVYGWDGKKARYFAPIGYGHIVQPIYEVDGEEEGEELGAAEEWGIVYSSPPVAKYAKEVAELRAEIAAKKAELQDVKAEQAATRAGVLAEKTAILAERAALVERLKQNEALKFLAEYLDGRR